jgi:hypothetical protein
MMMMCCVWKVCESQLTARLQVEVQTLQNDKEEVQSALQAAREKVHSLEVLMTSLNQDTVTQDTHDNQASFTRLQHTVGAHGSVVVKALCYKLEGHR